MEAYWIDNWMTTAKVNLPWPAFDDVNMKRQVRSDFEGIMEWMARILIGSEKGYKFKALPPTNETLPLSNPEGNDLERRQAEHVMTLAKFLAERTDDPRKGVGAVIINKEKEIVALGWNGFPTKALYGEFPRASDKDEDWKDKKYAYMIHAEQNALLMRNTKNIAGGTLFVTMTPCDECTPMLEMQGIKTFVLGETMRKRSTANINLNYRRFPEKVKRGEFICFEVEPRAEVASKPPASKRPKLDF